MKKVKSLMAVAVAVSVTLSAAVPVFAVNAPGRFATPEPLVLAPVVADVEEEAAPAATWFDVTADFPNLTVGSRTFIDNNGVPRGTFPVIGGAAQNPDFARLNRVFFNNVFNNFNNHAVEGVTGMGLSFHASFEVENFGQLAIITQTLRLGNMNNFATADRVLEFSFPIDKATNRQVSYAAGAEFLRAWIDYMEGRLEALQEPVVEEAEYVEEVEEPVPAVEEVEETEEAPAEEVAPAPAAEELEAPVVTLVPLGLLEDLGFEVLIDEEYDLVIVNYDGAFIFSFTVGDDYMTVGDGDAAETVDLPMATAFENGYIVIPSCIITLFLGLELPQYPAAPEVVEELEEEECEETAVR